MMARGRPQRTPEDDIRKVANYCRPLQKLVDRYTHGELEGLTPYDLVILHNWVRDTGAMLSNMALDIEHIWVDRGQVHSTHLGA